MQKGRVLINRGRRLSTAIALRTVEIQRGHAMLAVSALKCGATVQRFSCVISHVFIVVLQSSNPLVKRCATLGYNLRVGFFSGGQMGLIVEHYVKERAVNLEAAVVMNESQLPETVHEKADA